MSLIPISTGRVPNSLIQQQLLANITRTNSSLLDVQNELTTGKRINRPSDDPVRASAVGVLDGRLAAADQRGRNLDHAQTLLDSLDTSLGEASSLVQQAQNIASSQIGTGSDADTRRTQATVVDSILAQLKNISNRDINGVFLFGGSTPGSPPVVGDPNGFRYTARGTGLVTDLGLGEDIPVTLGGGAALGETSARQRALTDLNPNLTLATRLADLAGHNGLGFRPGIVNFQFNGGPVGSVSLTDATSVGEVVSTINKAIHDYETANSVTVLGPGGVTVSGNALSIDVAPGTLTFSDPAGGFAASDLGLSGLSFTTAAPAGGDVDPKLTLQTPLSAVPGLTIPLSTIRLRQTRGQAVTIRDVDLSGATTIDDVRNLIESSGLGVRVQVNDRGTGLDIFNEVAGPQLSVEETGTGTSAAELGLRTVSLNQPLSDFNAGRGVRIVDNKTDPVTGLPSTAYSSDFRVTLGTGQFFDVDLRPQDIVSVQTVLARIQSQFAAAVGQPPLNASAPPLAVGDFFAQLSTTGNGVQFGQTVGPGSITVTARNNSLAAQDLGLLDGTYNATSATLTGSDRTGLRVDSLFTDLLDLRDALLKNDSDGISLAGERLTGSADRLVTSNALVGTYAKRTQDAKNRLDDLTTLDTKLKEDLQSTDFTEAASRFSLLQTQLQAALQTAGRFQNQSLLDFLR